VVSGAAEGAFSRARDEAERILTDLLERTPVPS
jgi:hypothetical protein